MWRIKLWEFCQAIGNNWANQGKSNGRQQAMLTSCLDVLGASKNALHVENGFELYFQNNTETKHMPSRRSELPKLKELRAPLPLPLLPDALALELDKPWHQLYVQKLKTHISKLSANLRLPNKPKAKVRCSSEQPLCPGLPPKTRSPQPLHSIKCQKTIYSYSNQDTHQTHQHMTEAR